MLKRSILFLAGLILVGSNSYAITGMHPGKAEIPWSAEDLGSTLNTSTIYSLVIGNNGAPLITWQTAYSAAPSSITVELEASVDCSSYSTIDTSTSTAGEVRTVAGSYKCIRFSNSAVSGGSGKTLTLSVVYTTANGTINIGGGTGSSDSATSVAYADLGTPTDGKFYYCSDCAQTNPCSGSGSGAFAQRIDGTWSCAAGSGIGDPGGNGVLVRTALNTTINRTITAGSGISVADGTGVSGNPTISIDTAVIPQFSSGTSAVPGTGSVGTFYFKTDSNAFYTYPSTDTEHYVLSIAPGSLAQGDLFYLNSSGVLARLAAGTAGQVLQTNGAGADPSWVTSSASYDPTTIELTEEFVTGTNTTGTSGSMGVTLQAVATGTFSHAQTGLTAGAHWGLLRLNSHATNDNSGAIVAFSDSVGGYYFTGFGTLDWDYSAIVQFGSNSTAITNTALYVGWGNSNGADPAASSRAIWIRHDSDLSDSTFMFTICDSASSGCASAGDDTNQDSEASTITPVAGNWYYFLIRHRTSGVGGNPTTYFSVNGETEKTFCSSGCDSTTANLYEYNMLPQVAYLTRTTTGVLSADVDMMHVKVSGLTRY